MGMIMARHSLKGRRWVAACVRDTAIDVNTAVFWGVVLTGAAVLVIVSGTTLLDNHQPEGLGVLLVGAVVIGVAIVYLLEEVDHENGRDTHDVEAARTAGHVPGRLARALSTGLRHLRPADGAEATHGGDTGTTALVRTGVLGDEMYRVYVLAAPHERGHHTGTHRAPRNRQRTVDLVRAG